MKNLPQPIKRCLAFASAAVLAMSFATASKADVYAYELSLPIFGKLDLTTGVFTQISQNSLPQPFSGLANYNGGLYASVYSYGGFHEYGKEALYSVNPSTGDTTFIGYPTVSGGYKAFGSTKSGLYAVGSADSYLYSIDPNSGASTRIGDTNIPISILNIWSMSANGDQLFISTNSSLYQINTSSGDATLVGSTLPAVFGGMVNVNGVWYGGNTGNYSEPQVYTFNPTTAEVTAGALITGSPPDVRGLAAGVPEVSSNGSLAALLLVAALGALVFERRRSA